jgi:hypothetical protein
LDIKRKNVRVMGKELGNTPTPVKCWKLRTAGLPSGEEADRQECQSLTGSFGLE